MKDILKMKIFIRHDNKILLLTKTRNVYKLMKMLLFFKDQHYEIIAVKQYSKVTKNQNGDQICNTGTVENLH